MIVQSAELVGLADVQRPHAAVGSLGGCSQAMGHDDQRIAPKLPQRSRVEVVRMGMGDEDDVERADGGGVRGGAVPAQRPEPVAQERIGEATEAVGLDQDGRVADVGETDRALALRHRPRTASRSAGPPSRAASGPR